MRENRLANKHGEFLRCEGIFGRIDVRMRGSREVDSVLIHQVTHNGEFMCHHLWIDDAPPFVAAKAESGDRVTFFGRVVSYWKPHGQGKFHTFKRVVHVRVLNKQEWMLHEYNDSDRRIAAYPQTYDGRRRARRPEFVAISGRRDHRRL